ncbi:nitroreductase/quinone reductase family protein [Actinopolymorpha alba]|uniref:nitroreductase/quinone reductase family protein n=1 Tax=Actinopolymorpha alba TaxID=533267 RepID=UPI000361818F|nr:nitroreductase/quinone reductase family protein [Actinopolymorpha alba]
MTKQFPPRYLKVANKVIIALQRAGLVLGTMRVLTVPGRKTGEPRSTPVSPYTVGGVRYVVGGDGSGDWVKNAEAAGQGILSRGRLSERVRLIALPEEERGAILREFPAKVPHGVPMFLKSGTVAAATPEAFEAAAPRCAVFRIETL